MPGLKAKNKSSVDKIASDTFETILESMNKTFAGVIMSDKGVALEGVKQMRFRTWYEQHIINLNYNLFMSLEDSFKEFINNIENPKIYLENVFQELTQIENH